MTNDRVTFAAGLALAAISFVAAVSQDAAGSRPAAKPDAASSMPKPVASDPSVRIDFDIVYVRARRRRRPADRLERCLRAVPGEPGSDLVLLHPDGKEEVLVDAGKNSVADPVVSFDGEWVYYALYSYASPGASGLLRSESSDLYKIHIPTKRIVRLTHQESTPNTGIADPRVPATGVYNLGPCPVAGGKVVFTSTRNGFVASKNYKGFSAYEEYARGDFKASQLFVMDGDGRNVEEIGYMNLGSALGPIALADGRVVFSSFESQGCATCAAGRSSRSAPTERSGAALQLARDVERNCAPLRGAALRREDRRRGVLQPTEPRLRHLLRHGCRRAAGEAYFGSAAKDDPRNLEDKSWADSIQPARPRAPHAVGPHPTNRRTAPIPTIRARRSSGRSPTPHPPPTAIS
mgnify:CR=1 FL=1